MTTTTIPGSINNGTYPTGGTTPGVTGTTPWTTGQPWTGQAPFFGGYSAFPGFPTPTSTFPTFQSGVYGTTPFAGHFSPFSGTFNPYVGGTFNPFMNGTIPSINPFLGATNPFINPLPYSGFNPINGINPFVNTFNPIQTGIGSPWHNGLTGYPNFGIGATDWSQWNRFSTPFSGSFSPIHNQYSPIGGFNPLFSSFGGPWSGTSTPGTNTFTTPWTNTFTNPSINSWSNPWTNSFSPLTPWASTCGSLPFPGQAFGGPNFLNPLTSTPGFDWRSPILTALQTGQINPLMFQQCCQFCGISPNLFFSLNPIAQTTLWSTFTQCCLNSGTTPSIFGGGTSPLFNSTNPFSSIYNTSPFSSIYPGTTPWISGSPFVNGITSGISPWLNSVYGTNTPFNSFFSPLSSGVSPIFGGVTSPLGALPYTSGYSPLFGQTIPGSWGTSYPTNFVNPFITPSLLSSVYGTTTPVTGFPTAFGQTWPTFGFNVPGSFGTTPGTMGTIPGAFTNVTPAGTQITTPTGTTITNDPAVIGQCCVRQAA